MFRKRTSKHVCLAAKPNSTIEHLQVLAKQCEAEGLETCWLDLGHEPGTPEAVRKYSGRDTVSVHDRRALRRHFRKARPVAVWLHTPYPEHYPDWFWSTAERWPLAYVPYASGFPTGSWEEGQFGLDTFKKCSWLLATHEGLRDGYLRHNVPAERILLTGGPMMYEIQHPVTRPTQRNDLLWAPHWIEDYFGKGSFSTWRWVAPVLASFAESHPEVEIVVRPHPFLESAIEAAAPADNDANSYRQLLALPNVRRSDRTLIEDVVASDALISEGMSLNVYFATTGKPLGMTKGTVTDFPAEWAELLEVCEKLSSPEAVTEWLENLPQARPSTERLEFMRRRLPTFNRSPIAIWNERRLASGSPAVEL